MEFAVGIIGKDGTNGQELYFGNICGKHLMRETKWRQNSDTPDLEVISKQWPEEQVN
jgi:hypothetical protein